MAIVVGWGRVGLGWGGIYFGIGGWLIISLDFFYFYGRNFFDYFFFLGVESFRKILFNFDGSLYVFGIV